MKFLQKLFSSFYCDEIEKEYLKKQELDNNGYYVALNDNTNVYLTDKQYEELNKAIEKGEKTYTFRSEYILEKNLFVYTIFIDKICCITNAKKNQ